MGTRGPPLPEAVGTIGSLSSPRAHFSRDSPITHPDAQPRVSLHNCPAPRAFPSVSAEIPPTAVSRLCHGWAYSGATSRPLSGPYVRLATPHFKGLVCRYPRVCRNLCARTSLCTKLRHTHVCAFVHIFEFVGVRSASHQPDHRGPFRRHTSLGRISGRTRGWGDSRTGPTRSGGGGGGSGSGGRQETVGASAAAGLPHALVRPPRGRHRRTATAALLPDRDPEKDPKGEQGGTSGLGSRCHTGRLVAVRRSGCLRPCHRGSRRVVTCPWGSQPHDTSGRAAGKGAHVWATCTRSQEVTRSAFPRAICSGDQGRAGAGGPGRCCVGTGWGGGGWVSPGRRS